MGFGLVTGFIEHLYTQFVTTSNCSTIANSHSAISLQHTLKSSQRALSSPVFWQRFPTAVVPLPLGSRTVPVPQLPVSHSNSSQELNPSGYLTDSATNSLH
jgi:hypothetical protein